MRKTRRKDKEKEPQHNKRIINKRMKTKGNRAPAEEEKTLI